MTDREERIPLSHLDATIEVLQRHNVSHLVTIANHETEGLRTRFNDDPRLTVVSACREGEGVALACGLVAGGRPTVLCMENLGLFECLDSLRGLAYVMGVPLPIFVGYHGRGADLVSAKVGVGGLATNMVSAGEWTEPVLKGTGIPYGVVLPDWAPAAVGALVERACTTDGPFVVLVDNFEES